MKYSFSKILIDQLTRASDIRLSLTKKTSGSFTQLAILLMQIVTYLRVRQRLTDNSVYGLSGPAIKFGVGEICIRTIQLLNIVKEFIFLRNPIIVLETQCTNTTFLDCLLNEINADDQSQISMRYSAQSILFIQYESLGKPFLRKIAISEDGKSYLQRQLSSLIELNKAFGENISNVMIPRYCRHFSDENILLLDQSYIEGEIVNAQVTSDVELLKYFAEGVRFLMGSLSKTPKKGERWTAYQGIEQIVAKYGHSQLFLEIFEYISNWIEENGRDQVFIHGDFQLTNMVFDGHRLVGVLDWDRSGLNGTRLHDMLHLMVSILSLKSRVMHGTIILSILKDQKPDGLLLKILDYLTLTTCVTLNDIRHMLILLWLFHLRTSVIENQDVTSKWVTCMITDALPEISTYIGRVKGKDL